jgi:hypothetical protein
MNSGPFETVNISLPAELTALLRAAAARESRTLSGQIRHLVTQAVRLDDPPPPPGAGKVMQNVESTPEAIAAAKARLKTMRLRRDAILKRSQQPFHEATPATDDTEFRDLAVQIDFVERQILMAERFL